MKNFVPVDALTPFEPKTISAMGLAFEMSWQTLMVSGRVLVASFRADQTREALALRIIDTAATGERDVTRLRDDAVAYVQANHGKQARPPQLAASSDAPSPPSPVPGGCGP
jgi:hypothetical protein